MIIANFTPDTVEWQHVGIHGKLEPEDVVEFEDKRGNHILNKWGDRGLIRLQYNDKGREEELRKRAMASYYRFWEHQIVVFNQHNETLKNENKAYRKPTQQLQKKAEELEIELVGPWRIRVSEPEEKMRMMEEENKVLKKKLESLEENMNSLVEMMMEKENKSGKKKKE